MVDRKLVEDPSNFIAGRPKAALPFWFFGGFRCGVPLFIVMLVIYINTKIGKNRCLIVRLAGGHLYGKQMFTWLSLVVSLMASFVLSFFPLDVLDEIWDLIESVSEESVSEGFLTYSC